MARVLYGGRSSLLIGIGSAVLCRLIAVVVGLIAGFAGGMTDSVLSRVLDVPVAYFYDEMENDVAYKGHQHAMGFAEENPEPYGPDPMTKRETLELVRAYYKINEPKVRKRLFEMAKALAHGQAAPRRGAR